MKLTLGPAPILDFDGTIAELPVDWAGLRDQLHVRFIEDLWGDGASAWAAVTEAEIEAAARAQPVLATLDALGLVECFAVMSNNSSQAIARFFGRFEAAASKLVLIVGREQLGGPKRDPGIFRAGFESCVAATAQSRGNTAVVYVGDAPYELELAASLGAVAIDVRTLIREVQE